MNVRIATVIPLSKSLPKDHLDYFSTKAISIGDIVEIPIRRQIHKALIIGIEDAEQRKAKLKDASFQLKPIKKIIGPSPFESGFIETLQKLHKYYIGTASQIFSESISNLILDQLDTLSKPSVLSPKKEFTQEKLIFQKPWIERIAFYRTLIRESFAKGQSVRFIAPTIQDVDLIYESISKGIENYCFVFHSKKTTKFLREAWNTTINSQHPICIIHTPQFLSVPRHDIATIILEKENSPHYQGNKKPYIDGRVLVELYARNTNIKLIMSDTLLRTETLTRHEEGQLNNLDHLFFRIQSDTEHIVVDMRQEENKKEIMSKFVLEKILNAYKQQKKILLFALRSGLATTTTCHDCGTTQTYKNTPLILHINEATGERFFKSKKYGEELRTNIVCQECGSWNLESFGIGTQTVEELMRQQIPAESIIRIDQETTKKPQDIKNAVQLFEESDGGKILITSQIGLPYIQKSVDMSCIVSLDTLFNIPQFNMYEKIMHIIMDISYKTKEFFYIQTRYKDQKISSILQSKKLFDFFEYDKEERRFWEYPPFSVLIKMSYEGPAQEHIKLEQYIQKIFEGYELFVYHSKTKHVGKTLSTVIIKIPSNIWPFPWKTSNNPEETKRIREIMEFFPPSWSISVNPQSIL